MLKIYNFLYFQFFSASIDGKNQIRLNINLIIEEIFKINTKKAVQSLLTNNYKYKRKQTVDQ